MKRPEDIVPSNLGPLPCPSCDRLRKECTRLDAEERDMRSKLRVSGHWQDKLADKIAEVERERDEARTTARILAHAYQHDCRPPDAAVERAIQYPVRIP